MHETTGRRTASNVMATAFAAIFFLALFLPLPIMLVAPNEAFLSESGELPSEKPAWPKTVRDWGLLPSRLGRYFGERFGLRDTLIHWNATLHVQWLGTSPSPKVIVGKDGWLFFNTDKTLEDLLGTEPLSPAELYGLVATVEQWARFLEQRGVPLVVAFCPNKSTIYPEQLPSWLQNVGRESRLDQLMKRFDHSASPVVLDLRKAVMAGKHSDVPLYPKTESHWNDYAAFLGYRAIIERLLPHFPALQRPSRSDYDVRTHAISEGDLGRMMGLAGVADMVVELSPRVPRRARTMEVGQVARDASVMIERVVTVRDGAPIPRALVFRDSFGTGLMPFLSETFDRVEYRFTKKLDRALVDRECPDVVIVQMVERSVGTWWLPDLRPLAEILAPSPSSCFCRRAGGHSLPVCGASPARPPEGPLLVTRATWGALPDGPSADLTQLLQAQVTPRGTLSVAATVEALGEPAAGQPKTLSVDYLIDGIAHHRSVSEGDTLSVSAGEGQRSQRRWDVTTAVYGDLPAGPTVDVTLAVRQHASEEGLAIVPGNALFGDPAPGRPKQLLVEYQVDGVAATRSVHEEESLHIGADAGPP